MYACQLDPDLDSDSDTREEGDETETEVNSPPYRVVGSTVTPFVAEEPNPEYQY